MVSIHWVSIIHLCCGGQGSICVQLASVEVAHDQVRPQPGDNNGEDLMVEMMILIILIIILITLIKMFGFNPVSRQYSRATASPISCRITQHQC